MLLKEYRETAGDALSASPAVSLREACPGRPFDPGRSGRDYDATGEGGMRKVYCRKN